MNEQEQSCETCIDESSHIHCTGCYKNNGVTYPRYEHWQPNSLSSFLKLPNKTKEKLSEPMDKEIRAEVKEYANVKGKYLIFLYRSGSTLHFSEIDELTKQEAETIARKINMPEIDVKVDIEGCNHINIIQEGSKEDWMKYGEWKERNNMLDMIDEIKSREKEEESCTAVGYAISVLEEIQTILRRKND